MYIKISDKRNMLDYLGNLNLSIQAWLRNTTKDLIFVFVAFFLTEKNQTTPGIKALICH